MKFLNNVLCFFIIDFHKFLYIIEKASYMPTSCAYTFNIAYLKYFFPI